MSLATPTQSYLQQRLAEADIKNVLVVDDAFDVPTVARVQDDLDTFWNYIERDDGLAEQLQAFGIGAESPLDFDDDDVAALWGRRADKNPLIKHAKRQLFAEAIAAIEEVQLITASLQALGLTVDTVGQDAPILVPSGSLVFLDYYLGPAQDSTAVSNAAVKARDIYQNMPESESKPFIVLMSSRPDVADEADRFRDTSGILGGLFDFVSKEDLNDPALFAIKLATWVADMPTRHKIQTFVESLDQTMRRATQDFTQKVKALTIEDYAYVQSMSLEEEGHPLGDYMQWMFSSLLVNKVLEENQSFTLSKKDLNELSFQSPIPNQGPPSTHLAEVYSLAIAEPMADEIDVHPRVRVDKRAASPSTESSDAVTSLPDRILSQDELPALRLGDLLVKDADEDVYMVATPDCDLLFSPGNDRELSPEQSLLLIPGRLYPLSESRRQPAIQTQLYFHREKQYRIYWEPRRTKTIAVGKFRQWYQNKGYSRPARIRLPYAAKIQQEVVGRLTQLGMPIAPPLRDFVKVEYLSEQSEGKWEQFRSPMEFGATVIHRDRGNPVFLMNPNCIHGLITQLDAMTKRCGEMIDNATSPRRKRQLKDRLDRLEICRNEPERFVPILQEACDLPGPGGQRTLWERTIGLHRNGDFSGICSKHDICLNIVYR